MIYFRRRCRFTQGAFRVMGMSYILKNVVNRQAAQFCFCMVVQVLALLRHTAAFLTQTDFAVFYLINVDLVSHARLPLSSLTPQNC